MFILHPSASKFFTHSFDYNGLVIMYTHLFPVKHETLAENCSRITMWKCNAMMFTCFLDMFTIVAIKITSGNGLTPNLLLTKQWAKGELLKPGQGVRRPSGRCREAGDGSAAEGCRWCGRPMQGRPGMDLQPGIGGVGEVAAGGWIWDGDGDGWV